MQKRNLMLSCLVVSAVILAAPAQDLKDTAKKNQLVAVGEMAPDWQLVDPSGKQHSLSDYRGKIVVMDFWATWCPPCKAVMWHMQKLHEKYPESKVVVLGIDCWDQADAAAAMKRKNYTYTVLLKGEGIAGNYGVSTLPSIYIIGVDGRVLYRHQGVDDKNPDSLVAKFLGD